MSQVRLRAVTVYRGGITPADSDIMEHGCLLNKLPVNLQFGMAVTDYQTAVGDLPRVLHEQLSQLIVFWVILINNRLVIHNEIYKVHIF